MAKNKITEWSTTALSNSDVGGIGILGTNLPENFDDGLREIMKQIADLNTGASFIHDTYKIADSDDETKLAKFDAGSITAGQTRTFTFPNLSGTIALTSDVLDEDDFSTDSATRPASQQSIKQYISDNAASVASPTFTGDAEFENISDGSTTLDAGYVVNGSSKAWVNFNGSGTVAIRDSQNVSSLIDNGLADYTVNFSTDFDAFDYSPAFGGTSNYNSSGNLVLGVYSNGSWTNTATYSGTSAIRISGRWVSSTTANNTDADVVSLQINGVLA
jgi:hypothetical protein